MFFLSNRITYLNLSLKKGKDNLQLIFENYILTFC